MVPREGKEFLEDVMPENNVEYPIKSVLFIFITDPDRSTALRLRIRWGCLGKSLFGSLLNRSIPACFTEKR
jgi:hypothetical protein